MESEIMKKTSIIANMFLVRALLASSSEGIALVDAAARCIEVNAAFGRIFGIAPERTIGLDCLELLGCADGEESASCSKQGIVRQALRSGQELRDVEIDLHIEGQQRTLGLSIVPVAEQEEPLYLILIRDITAMRAAARAQARFISMITHELRSPINIINGYLDLALEGIGGELNEQQREFIQRARAGSENLYALIENLLLIARADAGQLRLNRELVDVQEVIANVIEEMALTASDQGIAVEVDIASGLPEIYADAVRLQQALRNLVSNALRFTPTGGQVTITACKAGAAADEEDQHVIVKVSDTGCGIEPESQERIFERFYQVRQGERSGSQGLGLTAVKMIMELHGGCVTVESAVGQGSTFTCILPCLRP
jgi:PAS domain S-box-containing protein